MIALILLILGLASTSLGAWLDVGWNIHLPLLPGSPVFHIGLASIGIILVVMAITAWLRLLSDIFGIFGYTLIVIGLTIAAYWGLAFLGLGPQLLPSLYPGTSSPGGGGGTTTPSTNSTSSGPYSAPGGLPSIPSDPLGINAFYSANPLAGLVTLVAVVIVAGLILGFLYFRSEEFD